MGVVRDGRVLAERTASVEHSHVGHLPELVTATLADAGVALDALNVVAVSAGPGSFTGLRIGAAFAKGLAYAGGAALVGVSTLEAHAGCAAVHPGALLCVANDARKGEVYAALFAVDRDGRVERRWDDAAWRPDALLAALPSDATIVGDAGAVFAAHEAGVYPLRRCEPLRPRGGVVARLGAAAFSQGATANVGDFEPTYVRAPDATLPKIPLR